LDQASDDLRPGLSTTAKITTAHKPNALTIPIQALVQRDPDAEKAFEANSGKQPTTTTAADSNRAKTAPVQGIYRLATEKKKIRAIFTPLTTGITGATDIEVLSGLKEGDEIVIGRYKILRTLKSGTPVKVDNSVDVPTTTSSDN
jgi:HlyD family secretion protein